MLCSIYMCTMIKIIGTSKVSAQNKVTIIEEVAEKLNVVPGDVIAYLETFDADIVIRKLSDIEIKEKDEGVENE